MSDTGHISADGMPPRKPDWLRVRPAYSETAGRVRKILRDLQLHSVCEQAGCPNCGECFSSRTATFLIMGPVCSRNCRFCQVDQGQPQPIDPLETAHLAEAVQILELRHAVITSVTRDDLPDGGAAHFAAVIQAIRRQSAAAPTIEVLIPDFQGNWEALQLVLDAGPDILNHNVETVPRLYAKVRPQAQYQRSLELLRRVAAHQPSLLTKSGLMVGLGESCEEILAVMRDIRDSGCRMLTIGQYLAPSKRHLPVAEYVHPDVFRFFEEQGYAMGFAAVASGPLVRSSYHAAALLDQISLFSQFRGGEPG